MAVFFDLPFNKVQDCKAMPSMFVKNDILSILYKSGPILSFRVGNCTDGTFSKSHAKVLVDYLSANVAVFFDLLFNKVQDCKAMPSMFVKMTCYPFYIQVDQFFPCRKLYG